MRRDPHAVEVALRPAPGALPTAASAASPPADGERIGNGRERAVEWLRANPDAFAKLAARLREPAAATDAAGAPAAAVAS